MKQELVLITFLVGLACLSFTSGVCIGGFVDICKTHVDDCTKNSSWSAMCTLYKYPTYDSACSTDPCLYSIGDHVLSYCHCLSDLIRTRDLAGAEYSYRVRLAEAVFPHVPNSIYYLYSVSAEDVKQVVR
ncbi:uncharacterized protein LOC131939610 [Physella acuta]|uniref:uncharacterized protein LOC131939610 n=1 Tax=Physella acuta TaxID=109671 RepID=UPI0027DE0CBA|nr:uncharacterized protein LOC131939610 [Physella acuta]XP_059154004.1 uncharacterized protein LOC131939610 [Physella acuta]